MEEHASFGYWVRRRRKALDLTQAGLAERAHCTESLIRKIEADERRPSRQLAELLADVLEVPPGDKELFLRVARSERASDGLPSPANLSPERTGWAAASPMAAQPITPSPSAAHTSLNLPTESTPFIGRMRELAELEHNLQDPDCRLITIVGPGGIGKSRLAAAVAQRMAAVEPPLFPDGVVYVALAPIDTEAGVLSAIAAATGFQFYANSAPAQQLIEYLRQKQQLLVLDNFEHVLFTTAWLSELLGAAAGVKVLVTSREGLGLLEEWFFPIDGLAVPNPQSDPDGGAPETADAVQLFLQAARRARVGFSLSATRGHVVRICQLVEGMPLGIELAAAWLRVLPVEEVAAELERSLDILTTRHQNTNERHRSVRAVFEQSWSLLPEPARTALRHLCVCRGGFDIAAARAMAQTSRNELATLVEKSLLRVSIDGRYVMHELLRQYVLERIEGYDDEGDVRDTHSDYYLRWLAERRHALVVRAETQALDAMARELENLRTAWQWAAHRRQWDAVAGGLDAFCTFYQVRSRYADGESLLTSTEMPLRVATDAGDAQAAVLLPILLGRRGALRFYLGDYEGATGDLEAARSQAEHQDDAALAAETLCLLGQIAGWRGQKYTAQALLEESLRRFRALHAPLGLADALHKLGQIHGSFGEYATAQQLAQESLTISRQLARKDRAAYALDMLGWATLCLGDYAACAQHYQEALDLFRQLGDRLGEALALGGLGSVEWARGGLHLDAAHTYMQQSLILCRNIGHRHHVSSRLWYLALIAVDDGRFEEALAYAEEGLAIAEVIGSQVFMAYNLCALGEANCGLGAAETGRRQLLAALKMAAGADHLPPVMIALIDLAELDWKDGRADDTVHRDLAQRTMLSLVWVARHPACWHPFRQRALRLSAGPRSILTPEAVAAVEMIAATLTVEDLVGQVLRA